MTAQAEIVSEGPAGPDPNVEELRVALALNGGVSLAVWMAGCAVELDRARRAKRADGERDGRRVFDVLCECLGRRLVIDIITGTSAGGINGALLGAAMAVGGELEPGYIRGRWIELGDLEKIMHPAGEESPTALMDGVEFRAKLVETFEAVLKSEGEPGEKLVPSLDVTMTDAIGVERRFRDAWGGELIAREHRPRFRFRRAEHFRAEALADAARTTASFPFAFDPWRVAGNPMVLADLSRPTYGLDGGLLDNAPIREALELIPGRPAATQVRRYVCYMNGDPALRREVATAGAPTLPEVGGYVLDLPRSAPLVDHLYAIRDAVERPKRLKQVQDTLLATDLAELEGVAEALLEPYRNRRTLESLEELLPEPGDADAAFDLVRETDAKLPWIPAGLHQELGEDARWEWGARAAQRAIHLLLDHLRQLIAASQGRERQALLDARRTIETQLAAVTATHDDVTADEAGSNPSRFDPERALERINRAAAETTARASATRRAVVAAAEAFRALPCAAETKEKLFGTAASEHGPAIGAFVRRALAIEVVRRAFSAEADIETTEELHFVQLTPEAPSPLFTSEPLREPSPASTAQKLTGAALHHFAGFFRRSWRANDFMWGRLDAAARIVDLLLDAPPADFGTGAEAKPGTRARERAAELATALVESAGEDGLWLLEEVLPKPEDGEDSGLQPRLEATIEAELLAAEPDGNGKREGERRGRLPRTRALFQRAAQLEVLEAELEIVVRESRRDRELGSGAKPLQLRRQADRGREARTTADRIIAIRELYARDESLPQRLTAEGEAVSNLGLQTITHAAFVVLSAIRTAGAPMSKYLGLARPPLLAVSGTVAASWWARLTAALGFWAAALFLTSRAVTALPHLAPAPEPGEAIGEINLEAVWSPQTLAALAALLGVLGFVAVPGLRLRQGVERFKNLVYAAGLLLAAGGLAGILALTDGGLDAEHLVLATGAEAPPEAALWAILGAVGVVSAVRLPLPSWLPLGGWVEKLRNRGWTMLAILVVAFAVLGYYSGRILVAAFDRGAWQAIAVLAAFVAAPLVAACAVTIWRPGRRPQERRPARRT